VAHSVQLLQARQKSGTAMAGPAVLPTTALCFCLYHLLVVIVMCFVVTVVRPTMSVCLCLRYVLILLSVFLVLNISVFCRV